ncbi:MULTISPECIES: hypothetical protein [Deinococcus]|nr:MULTISPECIES: hypothetical protein [Deinococcus]
MTGRCLAALLIAAFLSAPLALRQLPPLSTPSLLAGDNDKAGMGVG